MSYGTLGYVIWYFGGVSYVGGIIGKRKADSHIGGRQVWMGVLTKEDIMG